MNDKDTEIEIESLNLDKLDVEELEHRLELAMLGPPITDAGCQENNNCYINS